MTFTIYAPNGTVFVNGSGTLTIATQAYQGSTAITSGATYVWKKYSGGSWSTISGQTGSSLTVAGSTVTGMASYQCVMTYGGKTYQDVITLTDKTDNYQATIDSTGEHLQEHRGQQHPDLPPMAERPGGGRGRHRPHLRLDAHGQGWHCPGRGRALEDGQVHHRDRGGRGHKDHLCM